MSDDAQPDALEPDAPEDDAPQDDEGSVVLATLVVALVAMLAAVSVQRGLHRLQAAKTDERRAVALGGAERALAEAQARLELGQAAPFVIGATSTATDPAYAWTATATAAGSSYLVEASATFQSLSRTVSVRFTPPATGTAWVVSEYREVG